MDRPKDFLLVESKHQKRILSPTYSKNWKSRLYINVQDISKIYGGQLAHHNMIILKGRHHFIRNTILV